MQEIIFFGPGKANDSGIIPLTSIKVSGLSLKPDQIIFIGNAGNWAANYRFPSWFRLTRNHVVEASQKVSWIVTDDHGPASAYPLELAIANHGEKPIEELTIQVYLDENLVKENS